MILGGNGGLMGPITPHLSLGGWSLPRDLRNVACHVPPLPAGTSLSVAAITNDHTLAGFKQQRCIFSCILEARGPKAVPLGQNSSASSESPLWRLEGKSHCLARPHSGGTCHCWAVPRWSSLCICGHVAFLLLYMSNLHLPPLLKKTL